MRESNLLYLLFQKEVSIDGDFYYYTLDIANGLSLISNDSDEAEKEGWRVFLFNTDPVIEFTTKYQIWEFIALIGSLKKHNEKI
jgi:hypothetical protein